MAKFSFDTSTVEVSGSGSAMPPIPDGTYHAMVMDSEIKISESLSLHHYDFSPKNTTL